MTTIMVIRYREIRLMKNKQVKHPILRILIILLTPVILYFGFMYMFVYSLTKWHVREAPGIETKTSLSNEALIPELANYVERSGTRGFQDVDLQVETCPFASIDELCAALPSGSETAIRNAMSSNPEKSSDIKNKSVKEYKVQTICPFNSMNTSLPLNFDYLNKDGTLKYWTWEYSVYEYRDGTYRFVVLVRPT